MSRTREGWNSIPVGFGAVFDVERAPLWLRVAHRTPFIDRFTYPRLVSSGLGYLVAHPGAPPSAAAVARAEARGWTVVEERELRLILLRPRRDVPLNRD